MLAANLNACAVLELVVMFFQFLGVVGLCLSRLVPGGRWVGRGRVVFIVALVGLGLAGALCGRHDSEFALFAGVTMTALLIVMISGSCHAETTAGPCRRVATEAG